MFNNKFEGRTVLITGHTGFKGSWLASWLNILGANVVGIALDPPTNPSLFESSSLSKILVDKRIDIRNYHELEEAIFSIKPDYVFHLAAQSLVRRSYDNPLETWQTNTLGTLHILEALRKINNPCAAVIITSDKCYENVEWVWGYKETDALGGIDPYSASKGATEIAIHSYVKSFFPSESSTIRIASARAGNVIGGGDWADCRIIPDCVKAWSANELVELRKPHATRPWQHVLEPLSGYLSLAISLSDRKELHGEAFNFGPLAQQNRSVLDLVEEMSLYWNKVQWKNISELRDSPYESGLLKLNCDKALSILKWHAVMDFKKTVKMTVDWYKDYYQYNTSMFDKTALQINEYTELAKNKDLFWTQLS